MRRYRFSWIPFADATVLALACAEGFDPRTDGDARSFLTRVAPRPDDAFIQRHRALLSEHWLSHYAGARDLARALLGSGPLPRTIAGCAQRLAERRGTRKLRDALLTAMLRFGDMERTPAAPGDIAPFDILTPASCPADTRSPYDYQREAWSALSAHLDEAGAAGPLRGILSMPTASGKSYTTARWLAREVLSRGGRVLWVAHRHELLVQAAREFHRCVGCVEGVERLRVRVVSGKHCGASAIDPADHVVVASIASLAASPDARDTLLADPRLFVVIDEAHHAPARTYRKLIEDCTRLGSGRVLGLTATPTRTAPRERLVLSRLFKDRVLYQVGMRRLVERGTLARPLLVHVATGQDLSEGVTEEDLSHLKQFGELSEEWRARIAQLSARNRVIVDHYVDGRGKYGKTLVFATSVDHAALLVDDLRAHGVRADYVAHQRLDGSSPDNGARVAALRAGELDVLVNVQILTEGVDIPDVQTVFLARPTQSETLFRQMIGRALRGVSAGGTETAYLVAFEDQWLRFPDWEHPFALVPDVVAIADDADATPEADADATRRPRRTRDDAELHLWELMRAAAAELRRRAPEEHCAVFEAIPAGYYLLEPPTEDADAEAPHAVLLQAHHEPGWHALWDHLYSPQADPDDCVELIYGRAFALCDQPHPSPFDVSCAIDHARTGRPRPVYVSLAERRRSDPARIAEEIRQRDLTEQARIELIKERYGDLARIAYPELPDYAAAIDEALRRLRYAALAA